MWRLRLLERVIVGAEMVTQALVVLPCFLFNVDVTFADIPCSANEGEFEALIEWLWVLQTVEIHVVEQIDSFGLMIESNIV